MWGVGVGDRSGALQLRLPNEARRLARSELVAAVPTLSVEQGTRADDVIGLGWTVPIALSDRGKEKLKKLSGLTLTPAQTESSLAPCVWILGGHAVGEIQFRQRAPMTAGPHKVEVPGFDRLTDPYFDEDPFANWDIVVPSNSEAYYLSDRGAAAFRALSNCNVRPQGDLAHVVAVKR